MKLHEYKRALVIFKDLLQYHIDENELFYNIGNTYIEEGDYKEALGFLKLIRHMDHEKFNSIAKVFIRLKQYDSAQFYLTYAKNSFFDKRNYANKIDYGITLKYSGDLKAVTGKTSEAISDYQLAITHLDPVFTDTSVSHNPSSFQGLQNFSLLFDALVAKAKAFDKLDSQKSDMHFLVATIHLRILAPPFRVKLY